MIREEFLLSGAPREMIAWLLPVSWGIAALLVVALVSSSLQRDRFEGNEPIPTSSSFFETSA